MKCAYCGGEAEADESGPIHTIFMGPFGGGLAPLCAEHGADDNEPSPDSIWKRIAERIDAGEEIETC